MIEMIAYIGENKVGRVKVFDGHQDRAANPIAFLDLAEPSPARAIEWEPMPGIAGVPDEIQALIRNRFIYALMDGGWDRSDKSQIYIDQNFSLIRSDMPLPDLRARSPSVIISRNNVEVAGKNIALSELGHSIIGSRRWATEARRGPVDAESEFIEMKADVENDLDEDDDDENEDDEREDYPGASIGLNILELFGNLDFQKFGFSYEEIASRMVQVIGREGGDEKIKTASLRAMFSALVFDWITLGRAEFDAKCFSFEYIIDGKHSGYIFKKINKKALDEPNITWVLHGVKTRLPYFTPYLPGDKPGAMSVSINGKRSAHEIRISDFVKIGVESGAFADEDSAKKAISRILAEARVRAESMIIDNRIENHTGLMKLASDAADRFCRETAEFIRGVVRDSPDIGDYCKFHMENEFFKILTGHKAKKNASDENIIAFSDSVNSICSDLGFDAAELRLMGERSVSGEILCSSNMWGSLVNLSLKQCEQAQDIIEGREINELRNIFEFAKKYALLDRSFKGWGLEHDAQVEICTSILSTLMSPVVRNGVMNERDGLKLIADSIRDIIYESGISWEPGQDLGGQNGCGPYSIAESPLVFFASHVSECMSDAKRLKRSGTKTRTNSVAFIMDAAKICMSIFEGNGYDASEKIDGLSPREAIIADIIKHKKLYHVEHWPDERIIEHYGGIIDELLMVEHKNTPAIL